jgi:hypothetical protein
MIQLFVIWFFLYFLGNILFEGILPGLRSVIFRRSNEGEVSMDIRVLRYFITIAQEGSITKAAGVLHMTQPPLSRQMHELEQELGTTLFLRGNKRITLTAPGLYLLERAKEIVASVD